MTRIDYTTLAKANALRNRDSLRTSGQTLCPHTGEPVVAQKEAARRLGITPRGLRDTALPIYASEGRGGRTWYHADMLRRFERQRRDKANPKQHWLDDPASTPLDAFLSGDTPDEPHAHFEAMLRAWADIPQMAVALASGGPKRCHIDPTGAHKLTLLAREMERVAREHSGVTGVNGDEPAPGHNPDPAPTANTWDYAALGGDPDATLRVMGQITELTDILEIDEKDMADG